MRNKKKRNCLVSEMIFKINIKKVKLVHQRYTWRLSTKWLIYLCREQKNMILDIFFLHLLLFLLGKILSASADMHHCSWHDNKEEWDLRNLWIVLHNGVWRTGVFQSERCSGMAERCSCLNGSGRQVCDGFRVSLVFII